MSTDGSTFVSPCAPSWWTVELLICHSQVHEAASFNARNMEQAAVQLCMIGVSVGHECMWSVRV